MNVGYLLTGVLLIGAEKLLNLVTNLAVRKLDIIFCLTIIAHQREKPVVGNIKLPRVSQASTISDLITHKLHLPAGDVGHVHVVCGGAQLFQLLASKNVESNKMDLGVAVLSSLGRGHVDNLAGTILDHDETVLAESGALHREGGGGTGVGAFESVLMLPNGESQRRSI